MQVAPQTHELVLIRGEAEKLAHVYYARRTKYGTDLCKTSQSTLSSLLGVV